jgi:8-oxo-dGTP pyrophosphatase MutT (NUDIX family)
MTRAGPLAALLERLPDTSPPATAAGAAVLIVLRETRTGPETLLIERSTHPADPASGHVSFPGGRVDPTDRWLRDTALRELMEEVGVRAGDLRIGPRFVSIEDAPRFGMNVGVFAAAVDGSASPSAAVNPREVANVFWLPAAAVATRQRVPRETAYGPREVDAVVYNGQVLWGFTLRVLSEFLQRLGSERPTGAAGGPR